MTSVRWPLIKATLKGIGCSLEVVLTFIHRATSPVAGLQIAVWGSLKTYWRCSFGLPTNCNQLNHQARISPVMLLRCRAQEGAKNSLSLREPPHWPRHERRGQTEFAEVPPPRHRTAIFCGPPGPNPEDAAIARAHLRGAPKFMCPIGSGARTPLTRSRAARHDLLRWSGDAMRARRSACGRPRSRASVCHGFGSALRGPICRNRRLPASNR